jgi:hypothetical protein
VIEQECFDSGLQPVYEVVVSPDVGQLMSDDGLELGGHQTRKRTGREQQYRSQPADDRRHLDHD